MDDELRRLLTRAVWMWTRGYPVYAGTMLADELVARFEAMTAPPSPPAPESDVIDDIEAIICPELGEAGA